ERLAAAPVLGSPNVSRTLKDRARRRTGRIGNDRRIEERRLRTRKDRSAKNDPRERVAVLEIAVVRLAGEGVNPQERIVVVDTRLTAVTIDNLIPSEGTEGLER